MGWSKGGGPVFVQWAKGGDQNFLSVKEVGTKISSKKCWRLPRNFFLSTVYAMYTCSSCSYLIPVLSDFFSVPHTLSFNYCPLHCLCQGDVFSPRGGQKFFTKPKRGPDFFPVGKGGDQNFFTYAKGGP